QAIAVIADVLDQQQVIEARDVVLESWGRVDVLVNAAGGNLGRARNDERSIFDVPFDAFDDVLRLNLHGSVIPALVFAQPMALAGKGCVINISSMAATQAISGVMGYSAAKAAIDNFTRWLAVDLAHRHGDGIRVNAVAPGFFVTDQNRNVLIGADGEWTPRARAIIQRTPMRRFGEPHELVGAVHWLCSDAASFVTGAVIPVDGGFSAFSGV
ncbi:MAG: SDR family oxidoreductase, partial [Longimicrobiales bacterium]